MAQGDIHLFDDIAARFLRGELAISSSKLTADFYILLIDNTRPARSSDLNAKITDYTSARAALAPPDTSQDSIIYANQLFYNPFGGAGFVSGGGASVIRSVTIPFGDLRVRLDLQVIPTTTPASGANVIVKYKLHYPRVPGMTNVFQAVIFDRITENCLCFIDLTPDDGATPFNLDYSPLNIAYAEPTNGVYPTGWRLLFSTEAA